uniref:Secreted protein n=1 Tax=Heligmosomoides polygyrus TaxID=6339 RepID=A0A183GMM0_HELPZ
LQQLVESDLRRLLVNLRRSRACTMPPSPGTCIVWVRCRNWHSGFPVTSPNDRQRRVEVATQLLSFKRTCSWLKSIITGDEKWCRQRQEEQTLG